MCYDQKRYAFLTDYLRLLIIQREGGIYFDTDVEVLRSFDPLLKYPAFIGFETDEYVNTGQGFGAEAGNPILAQMLQEYDPYLDGKHGTKGCPLLNTEALIKCGLVPNGHSQRLKQAVVCSAEYFNPYDDATGVLRKTSRTFSIHWYGKSWMDKKTILRSKLSKPLHRVMGIMNIK